MGNKVEPYNCWDGVGNGGAGDDEFENILSILDFPMESLEGDGFVGEWDPSNSQYLGPIPSDVIIGPPSIVTGPTISPPTPITPSCWRALDMHELIVQAQGFLHTQSPVSVLESNGSSSAHKIPLIESYTSKRTRSKRARPSGLSRWLLISPFLAARKTCNAWKSRDRRKKPSQLSVAEKTTVEDSSDHTEPQSVASQRPAVAKRCTHCEVTRTPQWREGPMGPKTLCNACGVRYRSGRLFPEYRPAASPTFVPSLHSNSHRKVVEMRSKAQKDIVTKTEETPSASPEMEFVPMSSYLFDHIC
ncbi:hypothetical protein OROHE_000806 [Orobanche hederae]